MSLTFITAVKFYKNILDAVNHITFIYDKNWDPNNFTKPTFPICFFSVKSMHEVMTAEVSQKPMLFYNSNSPSDNTTTDAGLINVVADNIIIKPKSYKLDIIVPFQDLSLLSQSFIYNAETMQEIASTIMHSEGLMRDAQATIASIHTMSNPVANFLKNLIKSLIMQDFSFSSANDIKSFITNTFQAPDYNKNSLELMWQLRRVLKMKVWNSWEYKYVVITDLDISKEGVEDGVYEATMTVQEVPIATIRDKNKQYNRFVSKNSYLLGQGKVATNILEKAEIKS